VDLTVIRPKLKTCLNGLVVAPYTLAAARVVLGYIRIPDTSNMWDEMYAAGPFVMIMPGTKIEDILGDQLQYSQRRYQVEVLLWLAIPKETQNDFINVEKLVEGMASTLKAGAGVITTGVSWDQPIINVTTANATIVNYSLKVVVVGC
jgi:hypothetical protein